MLGAFQVIGSAVAAVAWDGGAEGSVAAVAGLEGVLRLGDGRRNWWPERRWGRQLGGQAVGEEGGGPDQGLVGQVLGQGVAYGGGGDLALQPGGDARGEVFGVGGGEEEPRVAAS